MTIQRRYFTKQRRSLNNQQRRQSARRASVYLSQINRRLPNNAKVGIYYDGFGELPTQPILDWCKKMGYQAYLPVVGTLSNTDKRLRFSPIRHAKLLLLKTYLHPLGMKQHKHHVQLWADELDIIFCPLVAVDSTGTRMGMGGGYYDRTLEHSYRHNLQRPIKLGWCYDFQFITEGLIPRQPWDIPLDGVVMPSRLLWF